MAKCVVEPFEVIDVDHEHRYIFLISDGTPDFSFQGLLHISPVKRPVSESRIDWLRQYLSKSQVCQRKRNAFARSNCLASQIRERNAGIRVLPHTLQIKRS